MTPIENKSIGHPQEVVPEEWLPLTAASLHVLLALADGEKHGYAIMKQVSQTTDGSTRLGPGTLYGTIKRLIESGLIEESDERPDLDLDDQRRRYYRLTGLGGRVASVELGRLSRIIALPQAQRVLKEFPATA